MIFDPLHYLPLIDQKKRRQCAAEGVDMFASYARLVELELLDRERRVVEQPGQIEVDLAQRESALFLKHQCDGHAVTYMLV